MLITSGANVNATTPDGDLPLHFATRSDSFKDMVSLPVIEMLLNSRAKVNTANSQGETPFYNLTKACWFR
jgi:ankyrin repeat protein